MAESLIEALAGDFDPTEYHDEYRAALQQVIDAKVEGREVVVPPGQAPEEGGVVDLMAALRASVEAAQRARGEHPEAESQEPVDRPTGRKGRGRASA